MQDDRAAVQSYQVLLEMAEDNLNSVVAVASVDMDQKEFTLVMGYVACARGLISHVRSDIIESVPAPFEGIPL